MNMFAPVRVLVFEFISALGSGAAEWADELSTAAKPSSTIEGESLLRQGIAMRDAMVADLIAAGRYDITVATSDAAPFEAPRPHARCTTLSVPPGASAAAFLSRLAPAFDHVWVVAPETDGILAELCRVVGTRHWVGCDEPTIVTCSSKRATVDALAAHGIAVPDRWQPGEIEPRPAGAWIAKPDDGAGTQDTCRHARFAEARRDLEARLRAGRGATLERWIEGEPLSLSLLCRSDGTELLCINRQRIALAADGALSYHGVDIDIEPTMSPRGRRLARLARRIRTAMPGLAGFVGVDVVWTPTGQPVVIEINPRLTCAYVGLSYRLGRKLAADILTNGEPVANPGPTDHSTEASQTERTA